MATTYPNFGRIDGPIVMIGFGSIGRGTLPLIERHFTYDPRKVYVIDPLEDERTFLEQRGVHFIHHAVTRENCRALMTHLGYFLWLCGSCGHRCNGDLPPAQR